jgi:uncharacterized protein (DUF2141 family)
MKSLFLMLVLFGLSNLLFAQSRLEVIVKGIKNDKGSIRVGLFKDKNTFLRTAVYGQVVKSGEGEIRVLFSDVPPGVYAVSVIHDENENTELDSGLFGIPKEGFGFGNDAMATFGPPSFEKASIAIEPGKMSINITVRYL